MEKSTTVKAKTVEEAVEQGAKELGVKREEVTYEVIEEAKKGFLGMFSSEATVKVSALFPDSIDEPFVEDPDLSEDEDQEDDDSEPDKGEDLESVQKRVTDFLNTIISDMGVDAKASVSRVDERLSENGKTYDKDIHVEISGKSLGVLIGRHGDVLDSLQYLSNIVVGKYYKKSEKHEYVRIVLDIENYREKREETLKELTRRMASKVLATGRNFTLEPMSAYERRIIHSEAQHIKGVHTYSIGTENNRRVVIAYGDDTEE